MDTCVIEVCELGLSTPIMFFFFEMDGNAHNLIRLSHFIDKVVLLFLDGYSILSHHNNYKYFGAF